MSKFRTKIKSYNQQYSIDYKSKTLLIGSCFSDNIGDKFTYHKLDTLINPYGILFNPIAIENCISQCIDQRLFSLGDHVYHDERWHSFYHHSKYSGTDSKTVVTNINKQIEIANNYIKGASHIIITIGTAYVYSHRKTDITVSNCHKIPQKEFTKKLLSVEDIYKSLNKTIAKIRTVNTDCDIIFTLSPIRHIKDGVVENSLGKANIRAAISQVLINSNTHYFPSYEIMMDDLRDYRFYEADMLHPNKVAIDYIWQEFVSNAMTSQTVSYMKKVDKIMKSLSHRSFNQNSESHIKFLDKLKTDIEVMERELGVEF